MTWTYFLGIQSAATCHISCIKLPIAISNLWKWSLYSPLCYYSLAHRHQQSQDVLCWYKLAQLPLSYVPTKNKIRLVYKNMPV